MLLARKPGQPPKTPAQKLECALEYVSSNATVFDGSFADLALHPEASQQFARFLSQFKEKVSNLTLETAIDTDVLDLSNCQDK